MMIFRFYLGGVTCNILGPILLLLRFLCSISSYAMMVNFWLQTLNTGSLFYATLNALSYFYMVGIYFLHGDCYFYLLFPSLPYLFRQILLYFHTLSGLLLGRIYLYHQPYSNACPTLHRNWALFFTALYCLCSISKY